MNDSNNGKAIASFSDKTLKPDLSSGVIPNPPDPTFETNRLIEEQTDKIDDLIFQHDKQIRIALNDSAGAKSAAEQAHNDAVLSHRLSRLSIGLAIIAIIVSIAAIVVSVVL